RCGRAGTFHESSLASLPDENPGALLDATDSPDEELARRELGLERSTMLGRQGDEQAARRLRVVGKRIERLGQAVFRHVCGCEVTVTRIAARPHALACQVERTVDRRESLGLQHEPNAAPLRNLVRMSEESE